MGISLPWNLAISTLRCFHHGKTPVFPTPFPFEPHTDSKLLRIFVPRMGFEPMISRMRTWRPNRARRTRHCFFIFRRSGRNRTLVDGFGDRCITTIRHSRHQETRLTKSKTSFMVNWNYLLSVCFVLLRQNRQYLESSNFSFTFFLLRWVLWVMFLHYAHFIFAIVSLMYPIGVLFH